MATEVENLDAVRDEHVAVLGEEYLVAGLKPAGVGLVYTYQPQVSSKRLTRR